MLSSYPSTYGSQSALDYPRSTGLGFNRQTWRAGQTVGRAVQRWWNARRNPRERARKSRLRAAGPQSVRGPPSFRAAAIPAGGGDSKSSFTLSLPVKGKLPPVAKEIPPSFVVNNGSGRVESVVGQQNFFLAGDYWTVADCNLGFSLLGGAFATPKVLMTKVTGETLFTNQENVNGRFTIYDVICRKDTNGTITNPLTAISNGVADLSGAIATDYLVPGFTPFMSPRFTEYFKVLQTTDVILSPGACHSHVVTYSPQKYLSKEITNGAGGVGIGGLTLFTLIQFHGTPINDVTDQTQVSLSHIAVDFVQKETYKIQYIHNAIMNADINQSLPVAFTNAGNTMQDDGNELAENEA